MIDPDFNPYDELLRLRHQVDLLIHNQTQIVVAINDQSERIKALTAMIEKNHWILVNMQNKSP